MTHTHDQPSLAEVDLPREKDRSVQFWHDEECYNLHALQPYAWALIGPSHFGKAPILSQFSEKDGAYFEDDYRGMAQPAGDDWRKIVAQYL